MQLLEDVFIIENLQVINEGRGNGPMKISGCFQRADEANNNKRIYDKKILEREIERLTESLGGRRLMGELDHPKQDQVSLRNVSHLITNLEFKGNEMIGEAELLNTPAGLTAQALIKGGVKLGISSRGTGSLTDRPDGNKNVNEDFKLIERDDLWKYIILAAGSVLVIAPCEVMSIRSAKNPGKARALTSMNFIILFFASVYFLKSEKITPKKIGGILLTIMGIYMIV